MDADPQQIARSLGVLFQPGDTVEARIKVPPSGEPPKEATLNGYYRNLDKLVDDVAAIKGDCNVYVCLNPCKSELYDQGQRNVEQIRRTGRGQATGDGDVKCRRWLLVDIDPVREVPGGAATDNEKQCAETLTGVVYKYLAEQLGKHCLVVADSGNGFHILIRLGDVPNDQQTRRVCEQVLVRLAERFDSPGAHVDKSTFNSSRICCLWGTVKRKGSHTADRPHRLTRLLSVPEQIRPCSWDSLVELAGSPQTPPAAALPAAQPVGVLDIDALLAARGIEYEKDDDYRTASGEPASRWILATCPFNAEHTDRSAWLVQWQSGTVAAGCHHNGCSGNDWAKLQQIWGIKAEFQASDILIPPTAAAPAILRVRPVKDVPAVHDAWLWQHRIPLGRLTVVAGNGGAGKTTLLCELSARITLGSGPPGAEQLQQGAVIWISDEESGSDIGTRVKTAGGDASQVFVCAEDEVFDTYAADVPRLRNTIAELGNVRAVVFDTLPDFLGQYNDHHNSGVRQGMRGLIRLARDTGVAVIGLCHFNKGGQGAAGHRLLGSVAYRNLPRSVLYVLADPDDSERRILFHEKCNSGPLASPLAFRLEAKEGQPVGIVWEDGPCVVDDIHRYLTPEKQSGGKCESAEAWLLFALGTGPKASSQILEEGKAAGHSKRMLYAAAKVIGVPIGGGVWQLPWDFNSQQQTTTD